MSLSGKRFWTFIRQYELDSPPLILLVLPHLSKQQHHPLLSVIQDKNLGTILLSQCPCNLSASQQDNLSKYAQRLTTFHHFHYFTQLNSLSSLPWITLITGVYAATIASFKPISHYSTQKGSIKIRRHYATPLLKIL